MNELNEKDYICIFYDQLIDSINYNGITIYGVACNDKEFYALEDKLLLNNIKDFKLKVCADYEEIGKFIFSIL